MDPKIAEALRQRLAHRSQTPQPEAAPSVPGKPRYLQDLEERAQRLQQSVGEVFAHDQQVLAESASQEHHLPAGEVSLAARDLGKLTVAARAHYDRCQK